jgi:fibroblast growth factor receptor 1
MIIMAISYFFNRLFTDSAQPVLNTPPIMLVDRNWRISETEPVGSVITRVRADDAEKDELTFDLEPKSYNNLYYGDSSNTNSSEKSLPFRIDPKTGVVRLNESLIGRVS